jgi:hypothetical protein
MIKIILAMLLILVILSIFLYPSVDHFSHPKCIEECTHAHSEHGLNYPWLDDIHGGLDKIQFMEPPSSGRWIDYTDEIWKIHCKVIDHNPDNLVKAHIDAFVDPKTRFAKLLFIFKDGVKVELDDRHAREFYAREADYFRRNGICG